MKDKQMGRWMIMHYGYLDRWTDIYLDRWTDIYYIWIDGQRRACWYTLDFKQYNPNRQNDR